jgi:ketosteroid isomerase-like protein
MNAIFTTPEEAEEAFYEAIDRCDLDALMSVWADEDEIICIHPTGQCLTGHSAIRESWRSIFSSNNRFSVRFKHKVRWKGVILAAHSVIEMLYLGDEPTPHGPMLSTNVFQRGVNGWRLLSHHTSTAADSHQESVSEVVDSLTRTLH